MSAKKPARRAGTFSDQLRDILVSRGSAAAVARDAGVSASVVLRFLSGERGMTTDTLDRIADAVGLRLVETRRGRTTAPKKATRTEPVDPLDASPES